MLAVRARALIEGRLAPSIDDVAALAEPVLKHRMALTFAARADGETIAGLIARLVARLGLRRPHGAGPGPAGASRAARAGARPRRR